MRIRFPMWLFAVLLLIGNVARAQVGFSPQYYDLALDEAQKTHAFRLFNMTKDDKQVRASVVNWDFDEHGEIRLLPGTDASLDQWVVVNPVDFTIAAGQTQAVRFSIRPATELAPGEHRAMLIFDEVLAPKSAAEEASPGSQAALRARFQFRTAIYCQVGQVMRTAELSQLKVDAKGIHLRLHATGSANTRFDGQYMVWKATNFPGIDKVALLGNLADKKRELPAGVVTAGRLPGQPVLPGGTRDYDVPFDAALGSGSYVAVLLGTLGSDKLLQHVALGVPAH